MGLLTLGTSPSQRCLLLSFLAINVTSAAHNTHSLKSRVLPSCHSGWLNSSLSTHLCQSLYVCHCMYQAAAPPEWTVSASVKAMHPSQPVCQNQPRELFRTQIPGFYPWKFPFRASGVGLGKLLT